MTDLVTNNRNLTQPQVGGDSGTWGGILNSGVMAQLDLVLGATQAISMTSSDVSLSIPQWNNAAINLTGALTGDHSLVLPFNANSSSVAVGGLFVVANNTTGAHKVTVLTAASGSTGVAVPQGVRTFLYSDTVNVWLADDSALTIQTFAGNPNGNVAGTAASVNNPPSVAWDYINNVLYVCTTTGNAAAAVWSVPNFTIARGFDTAINLQLSATHTGGNLLNVAIKSANTGSDPTSTNPVTVAFQGLSGANTTGAPSTVNIVSALNINTNATGATLGSISGNVSFRFWVGLFNNSGTPVLALRNCSTPTAVYPVAEYGVASTTPMSAASTAAGVWYTPNGITLTNAAFRLLGYVEYTNGLTTAGTYVSDPNNVVLFGPAVKTPGDIVQMVVFQTGAQASGTTIIPFDDTIPQNTEGDQYMSQAITPTSPINLLDIESQAVIAGNSAGEIGIMALFQDSTANALAASASADTSTNVNFGQVVLKYFMQAALSATTTFKIRIGGSSSTINFNGILGARKFGGVSNSFLRISEIMG